MKQYLAVFDVDATSKKDKNKRIVGRAMYFVMAKNDEKAKKEAQELGNKSVQETEERKRPGYSVAVKLLFLYRVIQIEL